LDPEADQLRRSHYLISQLSDLIQRYRALKPVLKDYSIALNFLWETLNYKQFLLVHHLLENLVSLAKSAAALPLAQKLGQLSAWVVLEALEKENWRDRLTPEISAALTTPIASETPQYCDLYPPEAEVINHFEAFLEESNPLLQMVCLYLIAQIDLPRSQEKARELQKSSHPEVQALAEQILQQSATEPTLDQFPTLEILVYLYNSDFFHWMRSSTLLALAKKAEIRSYQVGELVTETGDTCRELLLLVQGEAEVQFKLTTGEIRTQSLQTGQVIDELDVLARRDRLGTVMAQSPLTRILAVPVDAFDAFLAGDPDFARRVMELESRQLQEFIQDFNRP
jgi:CRP-like cAMP-binding protein